MAHVFTYPLNEKDLESKVQSHDLFIAGISIQAHFFKSKPNPFNPPSKSTTSNRYKLLYLIHGRCQSGELSKRLALTILNNYYGENDNTRDEEPLLIFTYDQKNHGDRTINVDRNKDWSQGNEFHAADMLSIIDSAVDEVKTVVEFLPCYFPVLQDSILTNIVSGVSMGGHITIRAAAKYPELFHASIPIVGSFDLSSLMINRLCNSHKRGLYLSTYEQIQKELLQNEVNSKRYPKALFDKISKEDKYVLSNYNTTKLKTFALFGELDDIVITDYSNNFLEHHGHVLKRRDDLDFDSTFQAIKYNAKHQVTDEMVTDITNWLRNLNK